MTCNIIAAVSILFLIGCKASKPLTGEGIYGLYSTVDNKTQRGSILTLKTDSSFRYEYMLGGCQDKIDGKWTYSNNKIYLKPVIDDTVKRHQPALQNITWEITKKGLKPDAVIDNGCFREDAVHKKY